MVKIASDKFQTPKTEEVIVTKTNNKSTEGDKSSVDTSVKEGFTPKSNTGLRIQAQIPEFKTEHGTPYATETGLLGANTNATRRLDLSNYTKYTPLDKLDISVGREALDEQRAQNQTAGQLIGNAAMQLGATILGGTITGVGAILALPELGIEGIKSIIDEDYDINWDNILKEGLSGAFYQGGIALEENARTEFPIYQTSKVMSEDSSFFSRFGDATYWASMAPTLGSAAASIIPVTGALKGVTMVGKVLQGINSASKLGKWAGRVGKVLSGRRAAQIGGTILGTHLDSIEEIARGYDEQYEYAKSLGFNDDEATRYASNYASKAYRNGLIANAATNAFEWAVLTKGIEGVLPDANNLRRASNKAAKEFARKGTSYEAEAFEQAASLGKGTKSFAKRAAIKTGEFAQVSLSEGIEEASMDFALNEAERDAKLDIGFEQHWADNSATDRYLRFLSTNAAWDSFLWGALGGVAMYSGRNLVSNVLRGKEIRKLEEAQYNATLDAIRTTVSTLKDYNGNISMQIDEDGQVVNPAMSILVPIFSELARANAFEQGDILLNELANMSQEEINEIYGAENQKTDKKEIIEFLRAEYARAKKLYAKHEDIHYSDKWNTPIRINMFVNDYLTDYYTRQKAVIEGQYNKMLSDYNYAISPLSEKLKNNNHQLYTIDSDIESISKSIETYNTLEDEYYKNNNKETNKTLFDKIDKYKEEIKEFKENKPKYSEEIKNIDKEIKRIRTLIKNIKLNVRKGISSAARTNYQNQLNSLKEKYDTLINRKESYQYLYDQTDVLINNHENLITIAEGEIENNNVNLESIIKDRENLYKELELAKEKRNSIKESNPEAFDVYENIKRSNQDSNIPKPQALIDLENILSNIDYAIAKYRNEAANIRETVKVQEANFDKLEALAEKYNMIREEHETKKETNKKEKEDVAKDISDIEESFNRPTEDEIYVSDEESNINETSNDINNANAESSNAEANNPKSLESFKIKDKTYKKGQKIVHNSSIHTIEDIQQLKNGNIRVKLKGQDNYIPVNSLSDIEVDSKIIDTANDIRFNELTDKLFENGFENGLDAIAKLLQSSKFKKILNNNSLNRTILIYKLGIIQDIKNLIDKYKPETIESNIQDKINSIERQLNVLDNNVNELLEKTELRSYIYKFLDINLSEYDDSINTEFQSELREFIDTLTESMRNFVKIINGKLVFNNITGYDTFVANVQELASIFKINLENNIYNKYELENFEDVKSVINAKLSDFLDSLFDKYKNYVSSMFNMQLDIVKTYLTNIENYTNKTELQNVFTKTKFDEILPTLKKLYNAIEAYNTSGKIPSSEELSEMVLPNEIIEPILNQANTLYNSLSDKEKSTYNALGIQKLTHIGNTFSRFFGIYKLLNDSDVQEANILHSINNLLAAYTNEDSEISEDGIYRNTNYSTQDIEYYISDNERKAYRALSDILNRFTELQIYSPSHKLTFEDILSVLYSQPNGRELVEANYKTLYYIINLVLDEGRINQIKSLIKNGIVNENKYKSFFNLLDDIQSRIANPKLTIDNKYLQVNGELNNKFIRYFEETYVPSEWVRETKNGVVLSNNNIFETIKNAIDPKTKIAKETIEVDGETYTIEELLEAEKSLYAGQSVNSTIIDNGKVIKLSIPVNGKELKVGEIRIDDGYNYHGLPLTKPLSLNTDEYVFDSWIGTEKGLSKDVEIIIKHAIKKEDTFKSIIDYVLEYEKQKKIGKLSDPNVVSNLTELLEKIKDNSTAKDTGNSALYNALLNATNYNTLTSDNPIVDLDRIYTVLNPIFYNIPREFIGDLLRNESKIKTRYEALRKRLISNFKHTDSIRKAYNENPNSKIVITHVDKPSYSFSEESNIRNNIETNIPTMTTLDGKPAVEIVSTQNLSVANKDLDSDDRVYSNVTNNVPITDPYLIRHLDRSKSPSQFYAVVESNNGANGKSLIPLRRTSTKFNLEGGVPYGQAAIYHITDSLYRIMSDRFLTQLSDKISDNLFQATEEFRNKKAVEIKTLLDDLSETIVVDNQTENDLQLPWFNVSNVFINETKNGKKYLSKDIQFIANDLVGNKYFGQKSYGFKIRVRYEYDENETTKSKPYMIEISRVRTKSQRMPRIKVVQRNGLNVQVTDWEKGLTKSQISDLNKNGFIVNEDSDTFVSIPLEDRNIVELLNTNTFQTIFGNMIRAVGTTDNNGAKMYRSKATGASFTNELNSPNKKQGSYVSIALTKLKMAGLYEGQTTFENLQDFYIKTGALTTGVIGTTNNQGKVISIKNYNSRTPNIYVDVEKATSPDLPNVQETQKQNIDDAVELLNRYASEDFTENTDGFKKMIEDDNLNRSTLLTLGLINENTSDEYIDTLIDFIKDTYKGSETSSLVFIKTLTQARKQIPGSSKLKKSEFLTRRGEYIPSKNAIVVYNNVFTQYENSRHILGITILHELLHQRVINDLKNKKINKSIQTDLDSIIEDLSNENVKSQISEREYEILNKYLDAIKAAGENQYTELISYVFTEPVLANILNRIKASKNIEVNRVSIWNRLLDAILNILGIRNVEKGSALEQLRNNIINNISLKAGVKKVDVTSVAESPSLTGARTSNESTTEQSQSATKEQPKVTRKLKTNKESNPETKTKNKSEVKKETKKEIIKKDDTTLDLFENTLTDDIPVTDDVDLDNLMAMDVTGMELISAPVGEGYSGTDMIISNIQEDFVYLDRKPTDIEKFKSEFIDEDGLKIC